MAFDINQFSERGYTQWGGARESKFDIQATLPTSLAGIDPNFIGKLTFSCRAATIPSFILGEVPVPYFGRTIKELGDRTWQNWRISVMLDEDYTVRAGFEAWNNAMNRIESNVMQSSFDGGGYKTNWLVTHYGKDGSTIRQYQLIKAWPKSLGPIVLNWDGANRINEFDVEVPFDNFAPTADGENPWQNSTSTNYFGTIDQPN